MGVKKICKYTKVVDFQADGGGGQRERVHIWVGGISCLTYAKIWKMPGVVYVHARVTTLLLLLVRMRVCEGRGGYG